VIGIWPRHRLVDGTETTQPEFSFWFRDVGWGVENYGHRPDGRGRQRAAGRGGGRDRQLETALAEAMKLIGRKGGALPRFDKRPNLARQRLPERRRP